MARAPEKEDSVYDFLYVDQQRIGLLLSQFGQDGVLQELVREAARGSETGGEIDLKLVKVGQKDDENKSLTRRFDPQWLIPLMFIDQAQDRIKREVDAAAVGDIVLSEGMLVMVDTRVLTEVYSRESGRKVVLRNARANHLAAGLPKGDFNQENAVLEMDLVTAMDPQVQMHLLTPKGWVWATLRPSGLITPASEIGMNHGIVLGKWHVLGIKDAEPELDEQHLIKQEEAMTERFKDKPYYKEAIILNANLRRSMGRPVDCYGVTPLLIFRTIG